MPRDERFFSRTFASFLCLGFLLLASSTIYGQTDPPHDQAEAWKWMASLLKNAEVSNPTLSNGIVRGKVRSSEFTINLATVSSVAPYTADPRGPGIDGQWYEFPYVSIGLRRLAFQAVFVSGEVSKAQKFQAALVFLARQAQQEQAVKDAADLEAFKPKAAAWRQLAVKPQVPEEALRHQVLAEYAYKQKDVPKAITEYTEALRIFPYWPAGQNNLAFLAAEVGTRPGYNVAIHHMKMYLELAPDASDAKAAQDSIFVWEDKRTTATP